MSVLQVGSHPVLAAVAVIDAALIEVQGVDPVFMTVPDKERALLELSVLVDRLEELRGRVLRVAEDVADRDGARDAAAWLAHHGRRDHGDCRRLLSLARSLAERPRVAERLRAGAVNLDQAQVIVRALADLPAGIDPGLREAAEERLVTESETFAPRQLRVLGRRVLDVLAPEVAEAHEGRLLEREEERAARRTFLTTRRNGDGSTEVRMRVADTVADRLLTYLEAFTSPRRASRQAGPDGVEGGGSVRSGRVANGVPGGGPGDRRPYDQRLGAAFASFLEAVDPARLPLHGGDATTVLVTVPLETLRDGTGVALIGDQPVSAGQARRLACTAGIVPIVLGGASEVLDAGRTRRLYSGNQRRALAVTHPTCASQGCDIPAAWCEAHHAGRPWAQGGRTDLADGMLLCAFHHHRAHDHHYQLRRHGLSVTFHRRT